LTAKTGIHAHYQNMVNQRKNLIEGVDWGGGVYYHAGFASVGGDQTERAIEMDTGFLMHGNPIDAGFGKCGDEFVGLFDHQVTIEGDPGDLAKRGDHGRADRKIRNEMAVHDIDVENSGSTLDGGSRIFGEPCEVSRENGGSEFDHGNV